MQVRMKYNASQIYSLNDQIIHIPNKGIYTLETNNWFNIDTYCFVTLKFIENSQI
jgi:hypothetical protein